MISDVLFEAVQEIERYQRELPACYEDLREDIEVVKVVMNHLRKRLDTPPKLGEMIVSKLTSHQPPQAN